MEIGGANVAGCWGYIEFFREIIEQVNKNHEHKLYSVLLQGVLENFDDIVTTIATGGSAAGLAIANYLTGSKLRQNYFILFFNYYYNNVIYLIPMLSKKTIVQGAWHFS